VYRIHNEVYVYLLAGSLMRDDDDDVYLDKLQTKGVKKYILYM
jgi:hypothetical protein